MVIVNDHCHGCGTARLSSNECEVCGTLLCNKCRICQDCYGSGHDKCTYCDGEGWGIVGLDWDSDDPINGPYVGETERCPNCRGSGLAKDMTFW